MILRQFLIGILIRYSELKMDKFISKKQKEIWGEALSLPNCSNLRDSGIRELSEYFCKKPDEIINVLNQAKRLLSEEWINRNINSKDESSVISFYNNTQLEIFELMNWHIENLEASPINYITSLDIAKRNGAKMYLDYGSGIGSGAILFFKNGFNVACADISTPLLDFIRWRHRKRNLNAEYIDLKKDELPDNSYDIVTCFDVLEHLVNPHETLNKLRKALKDNGLLILSSFFKTQTE